jgi:N-lysine methyltransferase SETD6
MALADTEDSFGDKSEAFIRWLQQNGTIISPKIDLVDLRSQGAGRGVVAKEDIDDDAELFSIPRASCLTTETSNMPDEIQLLVEDPWLGLITAMVYEYQQGADSAWKAYFDLLPSTFDTLMYWSEEQLKWLEGSAVINKIGKSGADLAFKETVLPVLRQHAQTLKIESASDEQLLALCHRMGSIILAYAFDLEQSTPSNMDNKDQEDGWEEDEMEEVTYKAMVPLADMLNADADCNNAKLYYEEDKVVMKSVRPIKTGDEIFNDYGPLPSSDLLRRYGYITEHYAKYDVVEVALQLVKDVASATLELDSKEVESRMQYLDKQGLLEDGYDISHATSSEDEPPQFSDELCILVNTLAYAQPDFDSAKRKGKLPKPVLSTDSALLLRTILSEREKDYALALETHALAEEQVSSLDADSIKRLKMAQHVVQGELAVLSAAIAVLDAQVETTETAGGKRKDAPTSNGNTTKKHKS